MVFIFALFLISWLLYLVFYFKLNRTQVFLLKMLTSIFLLLFGIITCFRSKSPEYALIIVLGLGFGVGGDFFLGMQRVDRKRKQLHLMLGILAFFCGHIFYLLAFQKYAELPYYIYFPIAIIIMLLSWFFIRFQKIELRKVKYLSYAYLFISALFLTFAFGTFKNGIKPFSFFVAFGALSFSASDYVLSFLYFRSVKRYKTLKYINIILYYLGQLLISASMLFV
ncbi:MAG TPA: hypothetical protein GX692_00745 [Acholeplasmataceae bacterium]|jgi:uncharacterized membrane protein YhhN|nr:hypothetical protein [Acholeplasmataceae bacterium]